MRFREHILANAVLLVLSCSLYGQAQQPKDWNKIINEQKFWFDEKLDTFYHSFNSFSEKGYKVAVIRDPDVQRGYVWEFKFIRKGKTIISVQADRHSMFMVKDHVLYFCARGDAHQDLTAYDLSNGRKLWENRLPGLSRVCYSGAEPISDKVNLSIDEDVVNVASRNVCGDVMGIFDRKSGKTLAFRVVEDRLDECVRPKQTLDSKQ